MAPLKSVGGEGFKSKLTNDWFMSIVLGVVLLLVFEMLYFAQTASSTFEITVLYIIAFAILVNGKIIYDLLKSE